MAQEAMVAPTMIAPPKLRIESSVYKQSDVFGERLSYIPLDNRPFINLGPNKISKHILRTQCNLLLYSTDGDELKAMRASEDNNPYDTNFSGLPELTLKEDIARTLMGNTYSDGVEENSKKQSTYYVFHEAIQFQKHKERDSDVFNGRFHFLNEVLG